MRSTSSISRRNFLRLTSTVASGVLLAACAPAGQSGSDDNNATPENLELSFAQQYFVRGVVLSGVKG